MMLARKQRLLVLTAVLACFLLSGALCTEDDLELFLLPDGGSSPNVIATDPADQQVGFDENGEPWVLFDSEMDQQKTQDAFRLSSSSGQVSGSFFWAFNRMSFNPGGPMDESGEYVMVIGSESESTAGVDLSSELIVNFFVGTDLDRPRFVSSTPANGDQNVAANTTITLTFSEVLNFETVGEGISIAPSFLYTASQNGTDIVITPASDLTAGTYTITVTGALEDTGGNTLANEQTITFTVGSDFIAPGVVSVTSGATTLLNGQYTTGIERTDPIVITFSEPMDPTTASDAVSISPFVASNKVWNATFDQLTVNYNPTLDPETNYVLTVDATAEDVDGNAMDTSLTYSFRTDGAASLRPVVTGVFQVNSSNPGGFGIGRDQAIELGTNTTAVTLPDFSPLDTTQWIDQDTAAGNVDLVISLRIFFSNNMIYSSVASGISLAKIVDPTATSLSIESVDVIGGEVRVRIRGPFATKDPGDGPIWRLRIANSAFDINGNTLESDYEFFFSY